jgi:formylglycine-generating enzyme required for sulfatase activity
MGVVYAAREVTLDREVAVKVMLPGMNAIEFVRESRITARLPHPGIPPVHALGELTDGRPFLVMKLIKGQTLDQLLRARTDPATDRGRFVVVFEQICQAVGYAHAQGITHRDLKPSNIMVGSFGEVQVMDWGLAKAGARKQESGVRGQEAGVRKQETQDRKQETEDRSEETGVGEGTEVATAEQNGAPETVAGQVKGTPAFMAPEQARGEPVDARADVFALGGVLAVMLSGRPPFLGDSVLDTILRAARAELDDIRGRLDACGADLELVTLAKRCLAARAEDRPADAQEAAEAVAAYRLGVEARLQRAERDRAVSAAEVREQRKRRVVQLALAGLIVLVALGGGIATYLVQHHRTNDRIAADNLARSTERQTRADALVQALSTAETAGAAQLINELAEYRDLTTTKLRELATQPITTKPGLHARLALVAEESERARELAAYVPECRSDELLTLRQFLKPHAGTVAPELWAVLLDAKADPGQRVRAAGALAALAPDDPRWESVTATLTEFVVKENPIQVAVWSQALEPLCAPLISELMKRYPESRARIEAGNLGVSELAAEATAFDMTASLLARYVTERPAELAKLAAMVDPRHFALFAPALRANKARVVPLLEAELVDAPAPKWAVGGLGVPLAAVCGAALVGEWLNPDPVLTERGKRRGRAAAALVALGAVEAVWPVFRFPAGGDPTARSQLLAQLAGIRADPLALIGRFETETDVSAQRALLVALGDFPPEVVPAREREGLVKQLLALYREHPDPGLHSAIGWLLRQKWNAEKELAAIDTELAALARARAIGCGLAQAAQSGGFQIGPLLPAAAAARGRDWYVNGEGQTYSVVRGAAEFTLGSPLSEPGRYDEEQPHRKQIPRVFAVSVKEVTVTEFLRFRPEHDWTRRYSPGPDTPAVNMTWYEAAEYCNWLSAREGIPQNQWCYEPNKDGKYRDGMRMKVGHLKLMGYRLPTEAEWEYACRSGAVTARYHGRGVELLARYGWFAKNSEERAWPVGRLRPNELGLFDTLGNAGEWCEDPALAYATARKEDVENSEYLSIDEQTARQLRGGSFDYQPVDLRCAYRKDVYKPGDRISTYGFRPARTLPE